VPLKLHFLNVGHGDCTIIEFPSDRLTVVDINRSEDLVGEEVVEIAKGAGWDATGVAAASRWRLADLPTDFIKAAGLMPLCDPLGYLDTYFPRRDIFRFVATHPDMDHLSGLGGLLKTRNVLNFWHVADGIAKEDFDESRYDLADWEGYEHAREGISSPKAVSPKRLEANHYWKEDGMSIWSPSTDLESLAESTDDPNLASYVLALRYGKALVVLGGDANVSAWDDVYSHFGGELPKATVLKASHHGRKSGYHQPSVECLSPDLTIISVGKKPPSDASQLYAQYSDAALSTRHHGSIVVTVHEQGNSSYESDRTRHDDDAKGEAQLYALKSALPLIRQLTQA